MIQRLSLSPVQRMLWERIEADEVHILQLMLAELKANLDEPWQFDRTTRTFWKPEQEPNAADADVSSS